jgi:hypothetical protein
VSGALPHYQFGGPASYQVSALVTGGSLVVADGSGASTVSTAGANAINVVGIAVTDASPIVSQAGTTTGYGSPLLDISVLRDYVSVVSGGVDTHVTYAAAATFGVLLKAAASGQVTPWVSGTDTNPATIVGRCTQPGGVLAGATVGRVRIF